MEETLLDILDLLREEDGALSANALSGIIRHHNRNVSDNSRHVSKKKLLDFYFTTKEGDSSRWNSWKIDPDLEQRLLAGLRLKPRRTASGVATVTAITLPYGCTSTCLYCPNDVRMPKSYLADEPACQRAERVWFDPYLQVAARMRSLVRMGHVTDKVELIVLGGTWDDYPEGYRIWFVAELFRALNEAGTPCADERVAQRKGFYEACGVENDPEVLKQAVGGVQGRVSRGELSFNRAMDELYTNNPHWQAAARIQGATIAQVESLHEQNETAAHRCVGLVIETRPDMVTFESLILMRRLGCTKIQMGVQSLNDAVLRANRRKTSVGRIAHAFALTRLFGFKTHAHFMTNLLTATPEDDLRGYKRLVGEAAFMPDEVKMYPCALIENSDLMECYKSGSWQPYGEQTLVDMLARAVLATPAWTRISRMIRDFSSTDIVAGNKKVNLREMVEAQAEQRAQALGCSIEEIRHREINARPTCAEELSLEELDYSTSTGREVFLQWVTSEGAIAGFLRLSLPDATKACLTLHEADVNFQQEDAKSSPFPAWSGEAMIREVHVYGSVAALHRIGSGAQHLGLGKQLVERACQIAHDAGYSRINVISAIGTREYYRRLGFCCAHAGLYQQRCL